MPYYDDDGNELNPDLIPKPSLCVGCVKDESNNETDQVLCTLTRFDQSGEDGFKCFAFVPKMPSLK
jgi:hypothetical protein